jgi:hypothetical protein
MIEFKGLQNFCFIVPTTGLIIGLLVTLIFNP